MNLSNFGEQFSAKVLRKMYPASVVDAITNREYEGEIKKPGDRVNILMFLNDAEFGDYTVGTDMTVAQIVDAEDQLLVEKRKYFNFSLDKLEDLFTYAGDIPDALTEQHAMKLASIVDEYVLGKFGQEVKAGNWIGTNFLVTGAATTMASLVTTATGGTISINFEQTQFTDPGTAAVENPLDGVVYFGGFETTDLYKGIRLLSTRAFVTPWWRISGITDTATVTVTEWDEATSGPDFEENYTLRGTFGGDGRIFPKGGSGNASLVATSGLGWEVQAAIATAVTAASIYDQVTLLAEALDNDETPAEGRKLTLAPWGITQLRQAAELQPTGIAEIFKETVLNGKTGRIGAFDVFSAQGARVSTRSSRSTASGVGVDLTKTTGTTGYQFPAHHISAMTFADEWSENRVVDAENQFARKYQGLFLFGAKLPRLRRKNSAMLLGTF